MNIRYTSRATPPYEVLEIADADSTDPYETIGDFLRTMKVDQESPEHEEVAIKTGDGGAIKSVPVTWYGDIGILDRIVLSRQLDESLAHIHLTIIFDGPGYYLIEAKDGHAVTMVHARRGEELPVFRVLSSGANGAHELLHEAEDALFYCERTTQTCSDKPALPEGHYFSARLNDEDARRWANFRQPPPHRGWPR